MQQPQPITNTSEWQKCRWTFYACKMDWNVKTLYIVEWIVQLSAQAPYNTNTHQLILIMCFSRADILADRALNVASNDGGSIYPGGGIRWGGGIHPYSIRQYYYYSVWLYCVVWIGVSSTSIHFVTSTMIFFDQYFNKYFCHWIFSWGFGCVVWVRVYYKMMQTQQSILC